MEPILETGRAAEAKTPSSEQRQSGPTGGVRPSNIHSNHISCSLSCHLIMIFFSTKDEIEAENVLTMWTLNIQSPGQ